MRFLLGYGRLVPVPLLSQCLTALIDLSQAIAQVRGLSGQLKSPTLCRGYLTGKLCTPLL